MFSDVHQFAKSVAIAVEVFGIFVMILGGILAIGVYFQRAIRKGEHGYGGLRRDVGRSIILGLEFLVAADIIRTVAVDASLNSVLVLGAIVLIRTFLSISLEMETEGKWPWQQARG